MAWFLRAIEQTDGSWACKHGHAVFDRHTGLPEALEHLHGIAETIRPAELIVHWLDGSVNKLGPAEEAPATYPAPPDSDPRIRRRVVAVRHRPEGLGEPI